jgi:hypothetical protein
MSLRKVIFGCVFDWHVACIRLCELWAELIFDCGKVADAVGGAAAIRVDDPAALRREIDAEADVSRGRRSPAGAARFR